MSADTLPPMPDPHTGEPRPPKAPILKSSAAKAVPWNPRKVPPTPNGEAPPLEWDYADARTYRWAFGVALVLVAAFAVARSLIGGDGFSWLTTWWVWVVFVLLAGLFALSGRGIGLAAGAEWFADRAQSIRTYELVSVTMEKDWHQGEVHLSDRHGHTVEVALVVLRTNEALWDLVYNGIRHSVANGAHVNRMAVQRLELYDVVSMREERWFRHRTE